MGEDGSVETGTYYYIIAVSYTHLDVYKRQQQNGCRIGGEQSGHIIFSKYASTGDGILTSLKMMEVMMARKQKMSQLCEGLSIYPQVLQNVRVADKAEALANPEVQAAVDQVTAELGDTGRILVRESGTEPEMCIRDRHIRMLSDVQLTM